MPERREGSIWGLMDAVSIRFTRVHTAPQVRAFGRPSPMARVLAQRDHARSDSVLIERELAILRSIARTDRRMMLVLLVSRALKPLG